MRHSGPIRPQDVANAMRSGASHLAALFELETSTCQVPSGGLFSDAVRPGQRLFSYFAQTWHSKIAIRDETPKMTLSSALPVRLWCHLPLQNPAGRAENLDPSLQCHNWPDWVTDGTVRSYPVSTGFHTNRALGGSKSEKVALGRQVYIGYTKAVIF